MFVLFDYSIARVICIILHCLRFSILSCYWCLFAIAYYVCYLRC